MMTNETAKSAAAKAAADLVQNGQTLGIGTGSTSALFIGFLGERIRRENLHLGGIATSLVSEEMARDAGVVLQEIHADTVLDLAIDGADEIDPRGALIKGGGGALYREKVIATLAREFVVIADESKRVQVLGRFPLPVTVKLFGAAKTASYFRDLSTPPASVALRLQNGFPFTTDDGERIYDLHFGPTITDPAALEAQIKRITGVVEVGLFVGLAHRVLYGKSDGTVEEFVFAPTA